MEYLRYVGGDNEALRTQVENVLQVHEASVNEAGLQQVNDSNKIISLPPPEEQIGETIGPYNILQLLGEGRFVYMAEQEEPVRQRVALKIIKLGMDTEPVAGRFEAEQQVFFHDPFSPRISHYLIETVAGSPLGQQARSKTPTQTKGNFMKRLILAAVLFGLVITLGMYVSRQKLAPVLLTESSAERDAKSEDDPSAAPVASARETAPLAKRVESNPGETNPTEPVSPDLSPIPDSKLVFNHTIGSLISPQTSYEQRQALWKKLSEAGSLDQALTELQHQVAADPRSAEAVTALGEGYYKKAGASDDVRDKAVLAMKADLTLEAALNLDPVNWEARFTKAVGMSYWPPELNKGGEVIEQLQMLIQQQESEDQRPQFARTYLRLGEQYEKAGYADYAAQVWKRGASLFPTNPDFRKKLSSAR
jgi:tetratricopeptide (TPR) repeat protein